MKLFAREDLHRALRNRAFCDRYVLYSWFFEMSTRSFFEHLLACCEDDQIPLRDEIRRKAEEFLNDHRKQSEREEDDRTEPSPGKLLGGRPPVSCGIFCFVPFGEPGCRMGVCRWRMSCGKASAFPRLGPEAGRLQSVRRAYPGNVLVVLCL